MALELDDFKTEALSLEDIQPERSGVPISENNASMLSATDSALTGPSLEQYRQTKEDLLNPESRERFLLRQQMIRDALIQDAGQSAMSVVTDEALGVDVRKIALDALSGSGEIPSADTSALDMLAEEAAITDAGVNETEQAANSRTSAIGLLSEVNRQKVMAQKAINSYKNQSPQSITDIILDVGELMVPMAEWLHTDALLRDLSGQDALDTSVLLGNQKQELFNLIRNVPIENRAAFTERLIQLVEEHEDIVLPDGNALMAIETLQRATIDNDYSDFERWFDNATSVLDLLGIGASVRALNKGGRGVNTASKADNVLEGEILEPGTDIVVPRQYNELEGIILEGDYEDVTNRLANARIAATRSDVPTTSPANIVKDANPEEARRIHQAAVNDETDEMAQALYGTNKEEAAAKDLLPEPEVVEGEIPNKVVMDAPETKEPLALREARNRDGNSYLTETEVSRVTENLIDGLENIEGMKVHKESLVVRTNADATFAVSGRYSPRDSGFSSPREALDKAMFAFRTYGFEESDFTVMGRVGDKWVEVDPADADAQAILKAKAEEMGVPFQETFVDYSVQLDTNYKFRPEDFSEYELLSTKRNFLDYLPANQWSLSTKGQGSLTQNLLDASSVLHPRIVQPTAVAVDRQFYLKGLYVDTFEDFTKRYSKLPKDRRAMMTDYINEANLNGIPLDVVDLRVRGFNTEEIDALKVWRRSNDAMWYAANADMAKTMRSKGFKVLVHTDSGTKLIGRPVSRGFIGDTSDAFDPTTGRIAPIGDADALYDNGGEIIRLADPIQVGGQWTDMAISRNTSSGGYTKAISENERVLSYREGYYPVMYDAKWFIEMTVRDPKGRPMTKVVASARNTDDRNRALEQLRQAHPGATFDARPDRRRADERANSFDEGSFQMASAGGFTSQRIRGERLVDAGVDLWNAGNTNLVDPLEAVASQIQQMTTKVAMRPVLDAMRARWMSNYGKYLKLEPNPRTGKVEFPRSITEVRGFADSPGKMVADARTLYNYIYSMENGYINNIDEGYRAVLGAASDQLGAIGVFKGEELIQEASKFSPTGASKAMAFRFLLAANPARQLVIQSAQNFQLAPLNKEYFATGLAADITAIDMARLGFTKNNKRGVELWDAVKKAGIIEAVDAHNFIRDDLLRMADLTVAQRLATVSGKPLDFVQKIGFDAAEQHVLMSAWLTFRDKAIKAGKDINSQRVQDEILGDARAYTFNMNRAGDMPYAKNNLSLITQFFSVQHKALLQGMTNRNISRKDRLKLLAFNSALFGGSATLPIAAVNSMLDEGPPSPEKDLIKNGLLDTALNASLTFASGEDQQIDWGDLAPAEAYGVGNLLFAIMDTGIGEAIANSPSGSLLFGNNPRVTQAFKTGLRYFNVVDDYEDPELRTKFTDVLSGAANLYSGYSNAFKSNYSFHTGTKLSSTGRITDADVTKAEAVMAALGFRTKTEEGYREIAELKFGDAQFKDDDVRNWYTDLKRHLARRGMTTMEQDMGRRIFSEAWRVFGTDRPRTMNLIQKQLENDARNGDFRMITDLHKAMGFTSSKDVWEMINKLPPGQIRDRVSESLQALEENLNGR